MYYSDILEKDPTLDPDGIHLQYPRLHLAPPFEVQPLHIDVIEEYIDTIIGEFRSWKNHPFKVELSIEIAHILMCLDRKEDAKEFLQFFTFDSFHQNSTCFEWRRIRLELGAEAEMSYVVRLDLCKTYNQYVLKKRQHHSHDKNGAAV